MLQVAVTATVISAHFAEKHCSDSFAANIGWIWIFIGQEIRSVPINAATTQCKQAGQKYLKIKNDVI